MKKVVAALSLSFLVTHVSWAWSPEQPLEVKLGQQTQSFTLKTLLAEAPEQSFTVFNDAYHKKQTYDGVRLVDILRLAGVDINQVNEITFQCADGYRAVMNIDILKKYPDAVISYRQKGAVGGDFDPIVEGKKIADPSPFYLVWPQQETYGLFPWPHQVVGIDVAMDDSTYAHLKPAADTSASVQRGYELFKGACLACHSINLTGGVIGPELNIPMNITEYRDAEYLKKFIRNPDSFRARSRMTGLPDLTDQNIEDAISYLEYMKSHKQLEKLK
ncbi:MAG: cytochrome c [Marinobacterium sp.]|nr:cytochrome c [Marinobacterium sp.]